MNSIRSESLKRYHKIGIQYEERICPICNKNFNINQRLSNLTCSKECSYKLKWLNRPKKTLKTGKCLNCTKEFTYTGMKDYEKDL